MSNTPGSIGRNEFLRLYGHWLESVADVGVPGGIEFHSNGWERHVFDFNLWTFIWNKRCFAEAIGFISPNKIPDTLVFAEIESVTRFSEVLVVKCNSESLQSAIGNSALPHFRTVCFDETCSWALIFENEQEVTLATRRMGVS